MIIKGPKIAVVGAGLCGLSAAYHMHRLCSSTSITIFERLPRIGGRVCTCDKLKSEHGGEFFLGCELDGVEPEYKLDTSPSLKELFKSLGVDVKEERDWAAFSFNGKVKRGSPDEVARKLLHRSAKHRLPKLIAKSTTRIRNSNESFGEWVHSRLSGDREAIRFIKILLAGETCAPMDHLSIKYGCESLATASSPTEKWFVVGRGTSRLAKSLYRKSRANIKMGTDVTAVNERRQGVQVKWTQVGDVKREDFFDAVIIATPDGERLLNITASGHFHQYLSLLIPYDKEPTLRDHPGLPLTHGLYVDNSLNYIKTKKVNEQWIVRALIPYADRWQRYSDDRVKTMCKKNLKQLLSSDVCPSAEPDLMRWEFGLPCGGQPEFYQRFGRAIFLAGDRFSKWPSMAGAIISGEKVANAACYQF